MIKSITTSLQSKQKRGSTPLIYGGDGRRAGVVIKTNNLSALPEYFNMNRVKGQFGVPLDIVPQFLVRSYEWLIENAIDEVGLFRQTGTNTVVNELKEIMQQGEAIELDQQKKNIHNVTTLIKMYFRELPEPICTYDCYEMFIECNQVPDEKEKLACLKTVCGYLPRTNLEVLAMTCRFLNKIAQNSHVNKMTPHNLAVVWAINLLRPRNAQDLMMGLAASQQVVSLMISEANYLFSTERDASEEFQNAREALVGESVKVVVEKIRRYSTRVQQQKKPKPPPPKKFAEIKIQNDNVSVPKSPRIQIQIQPSTPREQSPNGSKTLNETILQRLKRSNTAPVIVTPPLPKRKPNTSEQKKSSIRDLQKRLTENGMSVHMEWRKLPPKPLKPSNPSMTLNKSGLVSERISMLQQQLKQPYSPRNPNTLPQTPTASPSKVSMKPHTLPKQSSPIPFKSIPNGSLSPRKKMSPPPVPSRKPSKEDEEIKNMFSVKERSLEKAKLLAQKARKCEKEKDYKKAFRRYLKCFNTGVAEQDELKQHDLKEILNNCLSKADKMLKLSQTQ